MIISLLSALFFYFILPPYLPSVAEGVTIDQETMVANEQSTRLKPGALEALPSLDARAVGVWDPQTQSFLYEHFSQEKLPIASLTKLMTALLVLEQGVDLDQDITLEPADNDPEGARLAVSAGDVLSLRDLFVASLTGSANNATEALARVSGLSEAAFVGAMNERARSLGLVDTHFTDVTGLGASNHSTVHDLVRLAEAAFAHSLIREASTMPTASIRNQSTDAQLKVLNTNKLVGSDLRITAQKTGYTEAAGGSLVARVRGTGERELLFVVLGAANQESRFTLTRDLADWSFANTLWP